MHKGQGKWFPGKVTKVHRNVTYDIEYDDGDVDKELLPRMVRRRPEKPPAVVAADAKTAVTLTDDLQKMVVRYDQHSPTPVV